MKKLLLLISFVYMEHVKAQFVTIPDANFATYLQGLIPGAMNANKMDTTSTFVISEQTINVTGKNITNLSGIQYFHSLTYLYCNNNNLTSLPSLPNTLTLLNCSVNPLSSLPALSTSLTYLYCTNNFLTSLPALPNSITFISCGENILHNLPVLPTSLKSLYCASNSLTGLPLLPASLLTLDCSRNSLTNLPAIPNLLQYLDCSKNSLTSLPVLPNELELLYCDSNNIFCFSNFPNTIGTLEMDNGPYTCLPNYTYIMTQTQLAVPLCIIGNINACTVAGIEKIKITNQLNFYPNPAKDILNVECLMLNGNAEIKLFDVSGKLVLTQSIAGKTTIDASALNAGVYSLNVTNNEGTITKKLVIVK